MACGVSNKACVDFTKRDLYINLCWEGYDHVRDVCCHHMLLSSYFPLQLLYGYYGQGMPAKEWTYFKVVGRFHLGEYQLILHVWPVTILELWCIMRMVVYPTLSS